MSDILREDWRVVLADVSGTGIKAGSLGLVIAVQTNGPSIGRWTQLARAAIQLRFHRGAELWLEPHEVRAASPAEVASEKRRRLRQS